MTGHREQQVHHCLQVVLVQRQYLYADVEEYEGSDGADDAQDGGDAQRLAHVPGDGAVAVTDTVVGDGKDCAVIHEREYHDHYRG